MSKVTSKLQVTIPKVVAEAYGIAPGIEVLFEPCGEAIRVTRRDAGPRERRLDPAERLRLFDEAMARATARAARNGDDRHDSTARQMADGSQDSMARQMADGSQDSTARQMADGSQDSMAGQTGSRDRGWTREELYQDRGLPR